MDCMAPLLKDPLVAVSNRTVAEEDKGGREEEEATEVAGMGATRGERQ